MDINNLEFTSQFWHWFIIVGALGGIIYCFFILVKNNTKHVKTDKDGNVETVGHVWDEDLAEFDNPLPKWWFNLFLATIVFAVVYLILYPGLGSYPGLFKWTQLTQYKKEVDKVEQVHEPLFAKYATTDLIELSQNTEAMRTGNRLFQTYCAVCHGTDMRGGNGFPNLIDNDWLYGSEPETIKVSILKGRNGLMPSQLETVGVDIDEVIHYVYSMNETEEVRGLVDIDDKALAIGKEKFASVCTACHGADGKGNQALGAPNLTDNIWLYGGGYEAIEHTIKQGRAGVMPAQEEFLGDAKVHVLAAYVYSRSMQNKENIQNKENQSN